MFNNLTDLPVLTDYDRAKRHHDAIKPLTRGKNAGLRPICDTANGRKKVHYTIRTKRVSASCWSGGFVNAIACRLYDTDVLTFTENGFLLVDNTYPSNTTSAFISSILPHDYSMSSHNTRNYLHDHNNKSSWYIPNGGALWFDITERPWTPPDPVPVKKHLLNTERYKKVMAAYKPFIEHACVLQKIAEPSLYAVDKRSNWGMQTPTDEDANYNWKRVGRYSDLQRCDVMRDVENKEGWGDLVQYYFSAALETTNNFVAGSWSTSYELDPKKIRAKIRETIKSAFCEEIFDEVDAPVGRLANDPNEEYFR